MRLARLAVLAGLAGVVFAAPAQAATVDEVVKVPTKYGRVSVEIHRPEGMGRVPIILTYSPYNTLNENGGNIADDSLAATFGPKGYARAVADVIGTRNSTGCWDYGGLKEQQSGVDLVNALAAQPWSNGKVAMIGGSYDGTTANMVAVARRRRPGPRGDRRRRRRSATGTATPTRTACATSATPRSRPTRASTRRWGSTSASCARRRPSPTRESVLDLPTGRYNPCDSVEHTLYGYDTTPDYDEFWLERDYRKDAAQRARPGAGHPRLAGLQRQAVRGPGLLQLAAATGCCKILYMWQGPHGVPGTDDYDDLLAPVLRLHAQGRRQRASRPSRAVHTVGRTGTTADDAPKLEARVAAGGHARRSRSAGPRPARRRARRAERRRRPGRLHRHRHRQRGARPRGGLSDEDGWLYYATAPLAAPMRIAGSAILSLSFFDSADHGQISPTLVDVAPDGTRGADRPRPPQPPYRNGLAHSEAVPAGELVRARVRLAPQDQTVPAGHRLGLSSRAPTSSGRFPTSPRATRSPSATARRA